MPKRKSKKRPFWNKKRAAKKLCSKRVHGKKCSDGSAGARSEVNIPNEDRKFTPDSPEFIERKKQVEEERRERFPWLYK